MSALTARRPARYRHPAILVGVVGAGLALALGAGASFGLAAGLFLLLAMPVVFVALQRPHVAALILVAAAPPLSGIKRGLPVPAVRLSEMLIVGIAALILVTADRSRTRPWRAFDWLALGYAVASFGLGFFQLLLRGKFPSPELLGTLLSPSSTCCCTAACWSPCRSRASSAWRCASSSSAASRCRSRPCFRASTCLAFAA